MSGASHRSDERLGPHPVWRGVLLGLRIALPVAVGAVCVVVIASGIMGIDASKRDAAVALASAPAVEIVDAGTDDSLRTYAKSAPMPGATVSYDFELHNVTSHDLDADVTADVDGSVMSQASIRVIDVTDADAPVIVYEGTGDEPVAFSTALADPERRFTAQIALPETATLDGEGGYNFPLRVESRTRQSASPLRG